MFDFFSFAKHKYVCPPFNLSVSNRLVLFTGRDPLTQRSIWKSMASHFPSVVGNFCKVMTSGEAGHCQHLFPIMPRSSVVIGDVFLQSVILFSTMRPF